MNHFNSEEKVDKYLVDFESNAELYGNDIETFIKRRNVESACAQHLRETLQLGRNIALLAEADLTSLGEKNRADDLTESLKGEYRFIRELGRGGMGTVWLAEQLTPLREVAIKLILTDLDSKLVQRRFEAEQQSLAMMSHAGIAKVIDAESIEGKRPYFVMEYVDGIPITNYCNDHRLSLDGRLELFLQLCDAIQHAHQRGVIHRDIKPGNVLVTQIDGKPQVKVIDFGLAKIIAGQSADLHLTQANVALGSPMWMSPEQTQWKTKDGLSTVDTRSDVYSLGVILYQLLTNTTPIDSDRFTDVDRSQLFEAIRNEVPPYPSRRGSENKQNTSWLENQSTSGASGWKNTLRDDLDWVTMKALEKEPDRRYATVAALADDLRRFVSGKAVVARPPSAAYQLKKCIARNKVASIAVAVAALSLMACTAMLIYFVIELNSDKLLAEAQRERAIAAEKKTRLESKRADKRRKEIEKYRARFIDMVVRDICAADACASGVKYSKQSLERMVQLTTEIGDMNLLPNSEINLRLYLAHTFNALGEVGLAKTEYEKALKVAENDLGYSDSVIMNVRNRLAFTCFDTGETEAAMRYLAANEKLLASKGSDIDLEARLLCELGLARGKLTPRDGVTAIEEYRAVISKCENRLAKGHALTIRALGLLGSALSNREEYREAHDVLDRARLQAEEFFGVDAAISLNAAIDVFVNIGKGSSVFEYAERLEFLNKYAEKLGESHPRVIVLRAEIAKSMQKVGKYEQAFQVAEDGILACQRSASDRRRELVQLWCLKLQLLNGMKRYSETIEIYENEDVQNVFNQIKRDSSLNLAIQVEAVTAYYNSGDSDRATELIKTYEPIAWRVEGDSGDIRNGMRSCLARMLQETGQHEGAISIYEDRVELLTKRFGERSEKTARAAFHLAIALDLADRPMDALEVLERFSDAVQGLGHRNLIDVPLAEHYLYVDDYQQSFYLCEKVNNTLPRWRDQKILNEQRFRNQFCHAEAAARLGRHDVAMDLLAKIKTDAAEFEYLRDTSEMDRLDLIEGICNRQIDEFQDAEFSLRRGLKKVSENSGLGMLDSIENTYSARRYALQLATLYEEMGEKETAKQYRDMEFELKLQRE